LDKFKVTVLKALRQILKNQENPSFMEKDKIVDIRREIDSQLEREKGKHEPKQPHTSGT
jgi:hypothetical protein